MSTVPPKLEVVPTAKLPRGALPSEKLNDAVIHLGCVKAIADLIENSDRQVLDAHTLESAMLVIRHEVGEATSLIESVEEVANG